MPEFVKLGTKADLPGENEAKEFHVAGKVICVANVDGTYSAIDNVCIHRGGPIGQGPVMDGNVICPWHGWMWDPKTGQAVHSPEAKVPVYRMKVEGEEVFVEV